MRDHGVPEAKQLSRASTGIRSERKSRKRASGANTPQLDNVKSTERCPGADDHRTSTKKFALLPILKQKEFYRSLGLLQQR